MAKHESIGKRTPAAAEMLEAMKLPEALMKGNREFRKSTKWLYQAEREPGANYKRRRGSSLVFPYYKQAVKVLSSMPFRRKYTLTGLEDDQKPPHRIAKLIDNADREGNNLGQFLRKRFRQMTHRGFTIIQIDTPKLKEGATQADSDAVDFYAYFANIDPADFMGAHPGRTADGRRYLAQIRIQSYGVQDGKRRQFVTIYDDDGKGGRDSLTWTKYRRMREEEDVDLAGVDDSNYELVEEGDLEQTGEGLPFIIATTDPDGDFWEAFPPLEDLAYLNLGHYQSDSAQRNYLRVARIPIINRTGASREERRAGLALGTEYVNESKNKDGKLEFVETTGAAMKAGRDDLDNLEVAMKRESSEPEIKTDRTATEVDSDDGKASSMLHEWKHALELAVAKAMRIAARMNKEELPKDFGVSLFADFGFRARSSGAAAIIVELMRDGKLEHADGLAQLQELGVVSSIIAAEKLAQNAASSPPSGMVE